MTLAIDDGASTAAALTVASVTAHVFRSPIDTPVVTSFGVMRDRPMVLVRVEDREGAVGWGEIWCNFPSIGAEYRARMVERILAPMLEGQHFAAPAAAFARLTEQTAVLALQSGEPGPIAQAIAGIDIALWDLQARRQALPLWQWLGGDDARVSVYASGLNPTAPERLAAVRRDDGYRGFKLKVGFGPDRDSGNLRALRRELGDDMLLLADANQAWDLSRALREAPPLAAFGLGWLEEPLRADRGWPEWQRLAAQLSTPLAAGENVTGEAGFDAAIGSGALGIIQPDIAKWGGFTGGVAVARRIVAAGRQFCPHWLGGGIGLLASAHLLAAIGGGGLLEIDANPNPLRTLCWGPLGRLQEGMATLTGEPGLGAPPDLAVLRDFAVTH